MNRKCCGRVFQAAMVALTLAAICQELEKPEEERKWYGKLAGIIPYDFRLPTIERLKETYWNPYERRVLTPRVLGVGWGINFYALLENLGFVQTAVSEEDFLMPGPHIKEVLTQSLDEE